MTVKKELGQTGGQYENTAYQIDFGMAYVTETVVNNVPKPEPKPEPQPEPKTPEEHPQQPERSLPATGEKDSADLLLAALAMGSVATGLLYSKREKKEA